MCCESGTCKIHASHRTWHGRIKIFQPGGCNTGKGFIYSVSTTSSCQLAHRAQVFSLTLIGEPRGLCRRRSPVCSCWWATAESKHKVEFRNLSQKHEPWERSGPKLLWIWAVKGSRLWNSKLKKRKEKCKKGLSNTLFTKYIFELLSKLTNNKLRNGRNKCH